MAAVTKNFSFNTNTTLPYTAEGGSWAWNAGGGASLTATIDTTEDSSNDSAAGTGCLQAVRAGKNQTDGTPYWEWTGTWENLGVTSGQTVTECNLSFDWKCSTYTTGAATSSYGPAELRDSGGTLLKTFSASATFSATSAYATRTGTNQTGLSSPSNTTVKLRIGANPETGNSSSANVTLRIDWVQLAITTVLAQSATAADNANNLSDAVAVRMGIVGIVADSQTITDSVQTFSNQGYTVSDTLSASDGIETFSNQGYAAADTLSLSDGTDLRINQDAETADSITLSDAASVDLAEAPSGPIYYKTFPAKPPIGTQVNWAHPLAKGLLHYYLLNDKSGLGVADLGQLSSRGTFSDTTNITWVPDGVRFTGSQSAGIDCGAALRNRLSGAVVTPATYFVEFTPGTISGGQQCLFGLWETQYLVLVETYDTGLLTANLLSGNYNVQQVYTVLEAGKRYSICLVVDSGAASARSRIYLDGKQVADDGLSGTTYDTISSANFYIGEGGGGSKIYNGSIHNVAVYSRALTDNEVKQLSADPYQILDTAPISRRYIPSTTSPLTATVDDSFTLSDATSQFYSQGYAASDTLSLSDTLATFYSNGYAASDTLTLSDALATFINQGEVAADTLTLTDAIATFYSLGDSVSDTLSLSDAAVVNLADVTATPLTATANDSLNNWTDTLGTFSAYYGNFTDALSISDEIKTFYPAGYATADSQTLSDATEFALGYFQAIASDLNSLSDASSQLLNVLLTTADALSFDDELLGLFPTGTSIADYITWLDSVIRAIDGDSSEPILVGVGDSLNNWGDLSGKFRESDSSYYYRRYLNDVK